MRIRSVIAAPALSVMYDVGSCFRLKQRFHISVMQMWYAACLSFSKFVKEHHRSWLFYCIHVRIHGCLERLTCRIRIHIRIWIRIQTYGSTTVHYMVSIFCRIRIRTPHTVYMESRLNDTTVNLDLF